ncbi:MAG: SH3 domain-containing protein [Deltaproteobacteria bacterium]|nr:SH3 domain-containing protein [Deltaproteobacteria bacterium]
MIDVALFAAVAYFVKVRFFDKEPEPPASKPAASAAPSAAPSVMTRASAEVRVDPSASAALIETVPPRVMVEVLELSNKGFVKVKTASGKTGWVAAQSVVLGP